MIFKFFCLESAPGSRIESNIPPIFGRVRQMIVGWYLVSNLRNVHVLLPNEEDPDPTAFFMVLHYRDMSS